MVVVDQKVQLVAPVVRRTFLDERSRCDAFSASPNTSLNTSRVYAFLASYYARQRALGCGNAMRIIQDSEGEDDLDLEDAEAAAPEGDAPSEHINNNASPRLGEKGTGSTGTYPHHTMDDLFLLTEYRVSEARHRRCTPRTIPGRLN